MKATMLAAIAAALLVNTAVASEPKTLPDGKWVKIVNDGRDKVSITISGNKITFAGPSNTGEGTTVHDSPAHTIDDGVVFGYVRRSLWSDGPDSKERLSITPYAFRFEIREELLTIKTFKLHGTDEVTERTVSGIYQKVEITATENGEATETADASK